MRERAAFNRRWKAQEWLRQRAGEIEAFVKEEARLAEEARRAEETRRAEEARRLEEARRNREREIQNAESAKTASDALKALIQRSFPSLDLHPPN